METYKWYYHLISAERSGEPHETPYKLAGPLCDGGDVYFDHEGGGRLPDHRLLPPDVKPGEIVSLLGRNGSGRSTTVKTIMGLVNGQGSVQWNNQELLGKKPFEIAHAGLGYVPENRDIFPKMTVHENLLMGAFTRSSISRFRKRAPYARL